MIEWILHIKDVRMLEQIELFSQEEDDWWNSIGSAEKASIERGIAQADTGNLTSHDEAMEKYKKWL